MPVYHVNVTAVCLFSICFELLLVYDLPACLAPLDLFLCLDCLLVPDCKPVELNLNLDLLKSSLQDLFCLQCLNLGLQSYCLVHAHLTFIVVCPTTTYLNYEL